MKKTIVFLLSAVFMFTIFSCGSDKPAENLNDLKEKYTDKEFKNCDEFFVAFEEMMDVYAKTIDRVVAGDEAAVKEFEGLEVFMNGWNETANEFQAECPEKGEEFAIHLEEKMTPYLEKLMDFYMSEANFDSDWEDELENQISEEDFSELEAEFQE